MRQGRFYGVTASIGLHILFAIIAALLLSEQPILDNDAFEATLVKLNPTETEIEIRPTHRTVTVSPMVTATVSAPRTPTQVSRIQRIPTAQAEIGQQMPQLDDTLEPVDVGEGPTLSNVETPGTSSGELSVAPGGSTPTIERATSPIVRSRGTGAADTGLSGLLDGSLPTSRLDDGADIVLRNLVKIPKEKLGGVLEGTGNEIRGHVRLIRLKHSLSDWWQGSDGDPCPHQVVREPHPDSRGHGFRRRRPTAHGSTDYGCTAYYYDRTR